MSYRVRSFALFVAGGVAAACSSSSPPSTPDGGSTPQTTSDGGPRTDAGNDAGNCYIENARVPEEADGVCCEGLRKACVGIAYGDVSPCICTTAPCGTEEKQPPANVPCCEGIRIECTSVGTSSNVQCICGTPGADAGGD